MARILVEADGFDLIDELKSRDRHLLTLPITGYASREMRDRARRLGVALALQKPFRLADLAAAAQGVIAHGSQGCDRASANFSAVAED